MNNTLKSIDDLKWLESPIVNFYTDFDEITEEIIDVNKICMFHININFLKETDEEKKEMQEATKKLILMGVINPKDVPQFYQNTNKITEYATTNNNVKTNIYNIKTNIHNMKVLNSIVNNNTNKMTLFDWLQKQRNMKK